MSCSDNTKNSSKIKIENAKTTFISNYVNIVEANYNDVLVKTKDLQKAIDTFVEAPDQTKLEKAKQAWLEAREPYGQTEAYRFYQGPIDGDTFGEIESNINAWPLSEALIDDVDTGTGGQELSDSRQNIINNIQQYPTLSIKVIKDIAGYGGFESNVTVGYHAIEFLLWGQDNTAPAVKKAGQRSFTDFTTKKNAQRRKKYLKLVTALLVEDIESVANQWKSGANYRTEFLKLPNNKAIDKILTGAAKLSNGELAGERMTTAVINQDQEDEHSCFSDNTHRDIYLNALSIYNIINGTYTKVDGTKISGTSLLDVLGLINNEEATTLKNTATTVMTKVKVISDTKFFDYQIIGETQDNNSKPIMSAVTSLEKQGIELAQAGKTITENNINSKV